MADGDLYHIPTDPDTPHPLGRTIVAHNVMNRLFRAVEPGDRRPDRTTHWPSPDVYDQQGSSCTMQATIGTLRSAHLRPQFAPHWPHYDTETERHAAYLASQTLDPWDGVDYDGTSSDAPWRLLRDRGQITGWRWIFGLDEARQHAMHHGVFCTGTNWYTSMWKPDQRGCLRITPGATVAGGHEWRIVGYSLTRRAFRMVNSWGRDWGQSGRAWVDDDTFGRLLAEGGDCVTRA